MAVPLIQTPSPAASPADTGQPPKMRRASAHRVVEGLEVEDAQPLVRRSTRTRKRPAAFDQEAEYKPAPSASGGEPTKRIKIVQRRNPPRKASAPPLLDVPLPDDVLLEAFAPLRHEELQEWRGWTEVESEPAFFNHILEQIGIKDAKIQEVFSIDEGSFALLPKPIHGLIFLYQFVEESGEEEREDCPEGVWFANQTTADACATVAMLNIAMNSSGLHLGPTLDAFKAETRNLHPALRGYAMSRNSTIRAAHNSFARRIDILRADLHLSNKYDSAAVSPESLSPEPTPSKRKKPLPKKTKPKANSKSKKKRALDAAFHFIAYVPIGDKVWELDGLQQKPFCLGTFDGDDWAAEARSRIELRMFQGADEDNFSFNLLAICRSALPSIRQNLALTLRQLLVLDAHQISRGGEVDDEQEWAPQPDDLLSDVSDFGLDRAADIDNVDDAAAPLPREFTDRIVHPGFSTAKALELREELDAERRRLRAEYVTELSADADNARRVDGRKKDYGPLLHGWVQKLADKGLLKNIHVPWESSSDDEGGDDAESDGDSGLCITVCSSEGYGCEGDDSPYAKRGQCITVRSLSDSGDDDGSSIGQGKSDFWITVGGKGKASKDNEGNVPRGKKRSSLTIDELLNSSNKSEAGNSCSRNRGKKRSRSHRTVSPKKRKRSSLTVDDLLNPSNENAAGGSCNRVRGRKRSRSDKATSPKKKKRSSLAVDDLLNPSNEDNKGGTCNTARGKKRSKGNQASPRKKAKRRSLTVQDLLNPSDEDDGDRSIIVRG